MNMKLFFPAILTAVILLTGCESPDGTANHTGTGALLGGALGAATGALIGGPRHGVEGALIGGAFGAVTGGAVGNSMDAEERARLRAQSPQTYTRIEQHQPMGIADVKAMAASGLSDDVITSQIRNTRSIYQLSAADIIDLKNTGVSQKVIEFMINTPSTITPAAPIVVAQAPPPPPVETVVIAPGPGYVWVGGDWEWRGRWVWSGGHWFYPPYPGSVWIGASWSRGHHGWRHSPGHWR